MLIVFAIVCVCLFIVWLYWRFSARENKEDFSIAAACVTGVLSVIIIIITLSASYGTYLETRAQYDAVINQYKGAVTMYSDYATLDMGKAAFTDFKYQGYQENVSNIVQDLRREIVRYNKLFIRKRIMDKNIIFNWLIIGPDSDMKIINIVE